MKILCLIDSLGSGGAQKQMVTLAKGLIVNGHEVHLFTYMPPDFFKEEIKDYPINHIHILKKGKIGFNIIFKLMGIARVNKYDIILSFLHTPNFYNILSKLVTSKQTKHITSERSKTIFKGISYQKQKITHLFSDHLICNSFHECNNWWLHMPAFKKKSTVIYNGLDLGKYYPLNESNKRRNRILIIGTVGPAKNGICIIEALKILTGDYPALSISWFGRHDGHLKAFSDYSELMNDLLKKYSLEKKWNWQNITDEIHKEMHSHDVLVLASTTEGFPNVVCEAMAAGLPVIISKGLDHELVVQEGENGYLFDPLNPSELAEKIRRFYSLDGKAINEMRINARVTAEKFFDDKEMIKNYETLFLQVKNKIAE